MKMGKMDDEARRQTLEELMAAMGAMDGQRLPKPPAKPPSTPSGPGDDMQGMAGEWKDETAPPAPSYPGVDPRLADLIKKKKSGAV